MKKDFMMLTALMVLGGFALTAAPALADEHADKRAQKFQEADTDGDGFLSKDEMRTKQEERLNKMFSEADNDNDGKLSREELRNHRKTMHAEMKQRMQERRANRGNGRAE